MKVKMLKKIVKESRAKKILAALLATILFTGTTSAWASIEKSSIDSGIIGEWNFEEIKDKVIADISNNGKDGELKGNAVITESGVDGKGIQLSGDKGTFISIPSIINPAQGSFSISLWAKVDQTESDSRSNNTIILQQEGSGRSMMFREVSTGDRLGTYLGGENKYGNNKIEKDTWKNLIITVDSESKNIKLYVNGKLESNSIAISLPNSNDKLRIGDHKNNDGRAFKGIIDEVKVYNKVLNEENAIDLYREFADIEGLLKELLISIEKSEEILDYVPRDLNQSLYDSLLSEVTKAKLLNESSNRNDILVAIDKLQDKSNELEQIFNSNLGDSVLVTADLENEVRTIGKELFGINHRYHKDGYGSWNVEEMKMDEEFDALYKDASFGSLRYPGGLVSNLFQWKRSIGKVEDRLYAIHGNPEQDPEFPYFGLDEAAKYAEENNSEFIYVYGAGNGSSQDAADLVEYLNCEVGENPNGGIDWAEVRANNGRVEPYNVKQFEFGNEFQFADQGYWTNAQSNDRLGAYLFGGTFNFNNELVVEEEDWKAIKGKGTGEVNQRKFIKYAPVIAGSVTLKVGSEIWSRVDSLNGIGNEKVYTLNEETGEINFGDGTNGGVPEKGLDIRVSYRADKDGYVEVREAMKEIDPEVRLYTSYETLSVVDRLGTEHDYDGIAVHPYSGEINSNDPNYYEKILYRAEEKVATVKSYEDKMKQVLGEEKAKEKSVTVSEYGIFRDTSRFVKSQVNALYTSKMLMGISKLNVPYANRHCLVDFPYGDVLGPGQQAVIQAIKNDETGEYDFVATPSAKAFKLFNEMTGSTVIDYKVRNNKDLGNNLKAIDTMITTNENGEIYLMVVNSSRADSTNVRFNLKGIDLTGYNAEVWTLDGPSFDAENTLDDLNNVEIEKENKHVSESSLNYEFKAHSLTAIKLTENTSSEVNKEELIELFNKGEGLSISIIEGINNGEYHLGAKERLNVGLAEAKVVIDNEEATNVQVQDATVNLSYLISLIKSLEINEFTGDINGDKKINIGDLAIASKAYNTSNILCDLNKDGLITKYEIEFISSRIR
ncbi:LamG-like jellyroll fold domain-containing protein [Clostridium sp.]|uniref:LamG-like jellyroll fold domain-containing protein n=1 Tax=Clostridium sp. TaxID=1506 RepID=UPI003F395C59